MFFKKLFNSVKAVQDSQATMAKQIGECNEMLRGGGLSGTTLDDLLHANDELRNTLSTAEARADKAQSKLDHMTAVKYNQPTSPQGRRINRGEASRLYGDGTAKCCEETLTAYVVKHHLGETVANYVVPKVVRQLDDKGNLVLANEFHEFPELIEGLNLYAVEGSGIRLEFLFVEYWTDDEGKDIFIQPRSPQEANKVLLRMLQVPAQQSTDDAANGKEEIPAILVELMQECQAHQINEDAYWLVDLDYLGVSFNSQIDVQYKLEDYYVLSAQWLKQLRNDCMKRWEGYFLPEYTQAPIEPTVA